MAHATALHAVAVAQEWAQNLTAFAVSSLLHLLHLHAAALHLPAASHPISNIQSCIPSKFPVAKNSYFLLEPSIFLGNFAWRQVIPQGVFSWAMENGHKT
eukprot:scaffold214496_cov22-Tisochrysis_lutea.AAC.1